MRLIDADKLMESLNPKESVWVGLVLSELIANAETEKAISIEWIENYIADHSSLSINWSYVTDMIKDWEIENEIN